MLTGCEDGLFRGVYSEHRGVHNEYLNCRHYLLLVAKMWRVSPCVQIKYINYPPKLQRWTIFSQSPNITTVAKTEYSGISDGIKQHNLCQSTHYPHWWQWWSVVSCPGPITPPTALLMSEEEFSLSSHSSNEEWSVELATNLCEGTSGSVRLVS